MMAKTRSFRLRFPFVFRGALARTRRRAEAMRLASCGKFKDGLPYLCCALLLLTPFFYAFGFCFPRGDDYDSATRAMFLFDLPGGIYEIGREWLTWSGRFTYHFLSVFLGAAVESRPLYGVVCAGVLLLYGAAAWRLARALEIGRSALFALFAMLALCASHQYLPNFYLFTDSLTIVLQGALYLFYLGQLIFLWRGAIGWKSAALVGILTIGVYEHAALAVFITTLLVFILAWRKKFSLPARAPIPRGFDNINKVCAAVGCALLFSFLAPGNFNRGIQRGVDYSLSRLPELVLSDFSRQMAIFWRDLWPWATVCLVMLAVASRPAQTIRGFNKPVAFSLAISGFYVLFVFAVAALHAMSDAPLFYDPKLAASVSFFTAVAFGSLVWVLINSRPRLATFLASAPVYPVFAALICCMAVMSVNFRLTLANAANGEMGALAQFMAARRAYLATLPAIYATPPRGLLGEITQPDVREKGLDKGAAAIVAAWEYPVFPVYGPAATIAANSAAWPNKWAALFYGAAAIMALPPDTAKAGAAFFAGKFAPLAGAERPGGLKNAWLGAAGGENITFNTTWLVLEFDDEPWVISIFRPNAPESTGLAPAFARKALLEIMAGQKILPPSRLWNVAATRLFFHTPYNMRGRYCFLALAAGDVVDLLSRVGIFISFGGNGHYRLHAEK